MPQVFLGLFRHLRYILLLRVARPAHQSPKVGAFLHDADPLCEPVIHHASSRHITPCNSRRKAADNPHTRCEFISLVLVPSPPWR
jgi:hypothetical protein